MHRKFAAFVASLILWAVPAVQAQDFRAKLTVTVTDPSGMSVPAAKLELRSIQPRIGMAFKVTPKLVFRAGYGLYYTNFQSNGMMQSLGFSATSSLVNSLNEPLVQDAALAPVLRRLPIRDRAQFGDRRFLRGEPDRGVFG